MTKPKNPSVVADSFKTSGNSPTPAMTGAAARYIGVSRKTLLKYCAQGLVAYMRYPGGEFRFRQSTLDVFMVKCTIKAGRAA
jgi:excisionase family DNA binding protein